MIYTLVATMDENRIVDKLAGFSKSNNSHSKTELSLRNIAICRRPQAATKVNNRGMFGWKESDSDDGTEQNKPSSTSSTTSSGLRGPSDTSGVVSHLRASSSSGRQQQQQERPAASPTNMNSLVGNLNLQSLPALGSNALVSSLDPYSSIALASQSRAAVAAVSLARVMEQSSRIAEAAAILRHPSAAGLFPSGLPGSHAAAAATQAGLSSLAASLASGHGQDPLFVDSRRLARGFASGLTPIPSPAQQPQRSVVRKDPVVLFMECDEDSLSEYQCLIRKQIELFEADKEEAASSVQGRNKQVVEGQVGIRCRHCTVIPPRQRQKGCMYFPTKLDRIYQAAQNLSAFHLCEHCKHIPADIRKKISVHRERKSPAGGGKRYWGEGVRYQGVYEDSFGLRFRKGS